MELRKGDIFCSRNPMMLGRTINGVQKFWAKDNKSQYSHSGFLIQGGSNAVSFEALWTNKTQNFYKAYSGTQVLIGRHKDMDYKTFAKGWNGVNHHLGKVYAGHRLLFFLIPPLAKYLNFGLAVCSEMTMKFLFKAGLTAVWKGWNPDDVADMIRNYKDWEIVYEGVLK